MAEVQSSTVWSGVAEVEVRRVRFNFEVIGRWSDVLRGCSSSTLHETIAVDVVTFPII